MTEPSKKEKIKIGMAIIKDACKEAEWNCEMDCPFRFYCPYTIEKNEFCTLPCPCQWIIEE